MSESYFEDPGKEEGEEEPLPLKAPLGLPFTWTAWDDVDELEHNYYNVIFTGPFGNFSQGEEAKCVTVNFTEGSVIKHDDEGVEVKRQYFYWRLKENE